MVLDNKLLFLLLWVQDVSCLNLPNLLLNVFLSNQQVCAYVYVFSELALGNFKP